RLPARGVRPVAGRAVERHRLEGLDGQDPGGDGPQGQGAVHAAKTRPYWTAFRAGACRSIAPAGSGRNAGPTTLTLRWSGGNAETGEVAGISAIRLIVSRSRPPSALASVSG